MLPRAFSIGRPTAIPLVVTLALGIFLLLHFWTLSKPVQIGADEGFEMAKATEVMHGHKLYSEVWNDQPPLHTFINAFLLKQFGHRILLSRAISLAFSFVLLSSLYLIVSQTSGVLVSIGATLLCLSSPGFVELSSSCMLEIPALSLAVASIATLLRSHSRKAGLAASATLFGASLSIKLVTGMLLPIALIIFVTHSWAAHMEKEKESIATAKTKGSITKLSPPWVPIRRAVILWLVFIMIAATAFCLIDFSIDSGAFLSHFRQSWKSHFGTVRSYEYGSPGDYPFQWLVLFRNWDTTVIAVLGAFVAVRCWRADPTSVVAVVWLVLVLLVFAFHRPWWPYYYVHLAIPLAWAAAIRFRALHKWARGRIGRQIIMIAFIAGAYAWAGARATIQISSMRHLPKLHAELILREIEAYRPHVEFMYCDESIYSFHADIPMPPNLCVVPFKRFWSGEIFNEQIRRELEQNPPGLMLLKNDTKQKPFSNLLQEGYRLVYQDAKHMLFVHKGVLQSMNPPP
jgi:4-amino-4-deoxy-L-arabinose transferase-like glycosyltransferase